MAPRPRAHHWWPQCGKAFVVHLQHRHLHGGDDGPHGGGEPWDDADVAGSCVAAQVMEDLAASHAVTQLVVAAVAVVVAVAHGTEAGAYWDCVGT